MPVLEQREQQHEPSQAGLGPAQSGSSQQQAAGPSGAAAAAAAAQVLLGVQLGPAGSLGELQQVPEYDSDFELWVGALHKSSQSEGGEFVVGRCLELRIRGSLRWAPGYSMRITRDLWLQSSRSIQADHDSSCDRISGPFGGVAYQCAATAHVTGA